MFKIDNRKEKYKTGARQTRAYKKLKVGSGAIEEHPLMSGHIRGVFFVVIEKTKEICRQLGDEL